MEIEVRSHDSENVRGGFGIGTTGLSKGRP